MLIAENSVVSFHYKVSDDESNEVIDSSENSDPLTYLHGARNIIPGLEKALDGKQAGDNVEVTVEAAEAYGERSEDRVHKVPREALQGVERVEPGVTVVANTEQGQVNLVIVDVADDGVTLDANHPLAGRRLKFDVSIETVREASEEEISHGHVHGPGGHQHD
jgi:FKBP-type peptidyl-prolyl cis-trans isomerase SlyD